VYIVWWCARMKCLSHQSHVSCPRPVRSNRTLSLFLFAQTDG
jgi:hypothetical protein